MSFHLSPFVTINVAVVELTEDSVVSKSGPPIQPVTVRLEDLEGCKFYEQLLTLPAQVATQVTAQKANSELVTNGSVPESATKMPSDE